MRGLSGGVCEHECHGRGIADIFRRANDNTPRDEIQILAAVDQLCEIKNRRVRVGAAHRFDQRTDQIVMIIAALVVELNAPADNFFERLDGDRIVDSRSLLENIQRHARIAV